MNAQEYLNTVEEQLRCKKMAGQIRAELHNHLEDQAEALKAEGCDEQTALQEAVREMGDPVQVGMELDRIHRPQPQWRFIAVIGVFSFIGLILQTIIAVQSEAFPHLMPGLIRQIICTLIGFIIMIGIYYLDYTILGKYSLVFWYGYLALLFIAKFAGFVTMNGMSRTYELLLLSIPLYAGVLFYYRGKGYRGLLMSMLQGMILIGFTFFNGPTIAFLQLSCIYFILLVVATYKRWFGISFAAGGAILGSSSFGLLGFLYAVYFRHGLAEYQLARLKGIFQPSTVGTDSGIGYMTGLVRKIIGESNLIGTFQLPEAFKELSQVRCDYVVTVMFYSLGIVAGILILGIFALFLSKMLREILKQKNKLGFLIALSCCLSIIMQSITYIFFNLGGHALSVIFMPFLSYGIQGTLVNYANAGIILSVLRYKNFFPEPEQRSFRFAA